MQRICSATAVGCGGGEDIGVQRSKTQPAGAAAACLTTDSLT